MKYCTNCGKELPDGEAKFCPNCGTATGDGAGESSSEDNADVIESDVILRPTVTSWHEPGAFSFSGRATRAEFWTMSIVAIICSIVIVAIDMGMASGASGGLDGVSAGVMLLLNAFVGIPLLLWVLATEVRRLHDIGWSGWIILLGLIPFVGWIANLVIWVAQAFKDGDLGPNEYGQDPKGRKSQYAGGF